jgi:hypothetical protein
MMKMDDSLWSILVFHVASEKVQAILIDMYRFIEHLAGVHSLHFIIRDRVDDNVVVSFRILLDRDAKDHIESTIAQQLRNVISEKAFIINPEPDHPFHQYVAWSWQERMEKDGIKKFTDFYTFLNQFSRIIVEMGEASCFSSPERVEITRLLSGMLGCTEYGQLSTTELRIGYYDRIQNEYYPHLRSPL